MPIPIIAIIGGAIAAASALGGGGAYVVHRRKHPKQVSAKKGKKKIEKEDESINSEEKNIEKDVENAFSNQAKSNKPHGGEKSEEEEIVNDASTKSAEEKIEKIEQVEENVEHETEKTESEAVHEEKKSEKTESGVKKSHTQKKESKNELKFIKTAGKEEVTEEKEEDEIIGELKNALVLMSTTKKITEEARISAIIEDRQEVISDHLSRNLDGIARRLGRFASYSEITNQTLAWMKNTFWPAVFRDFEAKLRLELYEKRVEDSLMVRVGAALDVAKAAINRLEHSEHRIEKLTKFELSEKKKSIKDLNNHIKLKKKELRKVKKKADSRLAADLQKEIRILNSHKTRLESVNKEIDNTVRTINKNHSRAKSMLKILQNWSGAIIVHEHRMADIHEEVIKKVKSVETVVEETKKTIERFYVENATFESIAVDSIKEINRFFEKYEDILKFINKFHEEMKETVSACINMAHNERSLFFLLDGIEKAQQSIERGTEGVIALSEAIMQTESVLKSDLDQEIKELEQQVIGMNELEKMTERLEKAAAYVKAEASQALQAIDYEMKELDRVIQLAESEKNAIVDAVRKTANRFVRRMKQVDKKYLSPVKEFETAAAAGRKASNRDYRIAA